MIDRDNVISIHEAGHSIVARALALHCGGATMADGCGRADYEDDEAEHGSIATIIAHMAGAAAGRVLLGGIADGIAPDPARAEKLGVGQRTDELPHRHDQRHSRNFFRGGASARGRNPCFQVRGGTFSLFLPFTIMDAISRRRRVASNRRRPAVVRT